MKIDSYIEKNKEKITKAEHAREKILLAAFDEIHRHGYQGMRIDALLKKTGHTKGALYHYFPNKQALAYSVIEEVILNYMKQDWEERIVNGDKDIISNLQTVLIEVLLEDPNLIELGCPINNLAQEMSSIDDGINRRLEHIYQLWIAMVKSSLDDGVKQGIVKPDTNTLAASTFLVSSYEGIIGLAKCMRTMVVVENSTIALHSYLENLRNI